MVTLKEIAEEAGVSVMTVSNVINHNHTRVSKDTRERVQAIVKKRHYVPNLSARSLSGKQSHIVAVLSPLGSVSENLMDDPYRQQMIGYLELNLRAKGYYVMLHPYSTAHDVLSLFHNWNIAGAIMFYPLLHQADMQAILADVPTVVIDRYYEALNPLTVDLDDYHGGSLSAKFLLQNGHRRIAFVCPFQTPSLVVKHRIAGFADALRQAGVPFPAELFFNVGGNYQDGIAVGKAIARMKNPPTAAVATIDRLAIGILEGMRLSGLSVPHDLSVIGFDNWPVLQYVNPKLTTIAQDFEKKAQHITTLLLGAIEKTALACTHITLDVELIERQSVSRIP